MSVIKCWQIVTCANCGCHRLPPHDRPCTGCADRLRTNGSQPTSETRVVTVAPAEQIQGAVKALEAIVDAGRVSDDADGWVYARRLRDIASDALLNLKRG